MRIRRFVLAGVLLGCAVPLTAGAQSGSPVVQVLQRLTDAPVIRGVFEQRKSMKGFRHPLRSHGDFVVDRQRGTIWHTREPFESTLILSRDRIRVIRADGNVDTRVEPDRDPGLREIGEMLLALLASDLDGLSRRFHIQSQAPGTDSGRSLWRIELLPRDAALAQWVARIELEGDEYLRAIRLLEAQGDTTRIDLRGHVVARSLTGEEAALFD